MRLADGRVLCVYGYRRYPEPGVRGCVSEDGFTWKKENEFVICAIKNMPSAFMHLGYPSSVELDDGTIVTVYHRFWWEWENVEESVGAERQDLPPLPKEQLESGKLPWRRYVEGARYRL